MNGLKSYTKLNLIQVIVLFIILVSVTFIAMFTIIAVIRSLYPYELEWIEGAELDEILHIMQGKPLYGVPSVSFIPSTKTPLFYFLSAGISKILGPGFFAPRMLSIAASLGIFTILFLIVKNDGSSKVAGLLSAGIMAASFRFTGAWLDLVKTDALFLFFILAAFYVAQKYPTRLGMIASGLLFVSAYYTKQLALVIIIALCISSLVETRGRSWIQWLTVGVVGSLVFIIADWVTKGWFSFYTVDVLTYHHWSDSLLYFVKKILTKFWPALLVGLMYVILSYKNVIKLKFPGKMWQKLSFVAATIAASASVFMKSWTYDNGYIPAVIGISFLLGLGYDRIFRWGDTANHQWRVTLVKIVAGVLVLLQFWFLVYNPIKQIPTAADKQAAQSFVTLLKSLPGEVLVFNHGSYYTPADKNSYFQSAKLGDILAASLQTENNNDAVRGKMAEESVSQAIEGQYFDSIIADGKPEQFLPYYIVSKDPLFEDKNVFFPVTGARTHPNILLVRNPILHGGVLPLMTPDLSNLFVEGWQDYLNELWASGQKSVINIALQQDHDYRINITLQPACKDQIPAFISVTTNWNDQMLDSTSTTTCQPVIRGIDLPKELILEGLNQLSLNFRDVGNQSTSPEVATRIAILSELSFLQK